MPNLKRRCSSRSNTNIRLQLMRCGRAPVVQTMSTCPAPQVLKRPLGCGASLPGRATSLLTLQQLQRRQQPDSSSHLLRGPSTGRSPHNPRTEARAQPSLGHRTLPSTMALTSNSTPSPSTLRPTTHEPGAEVGDQNCIHQKYTATLTLFALSSHHRSLLYLNKPYSQTLQTRTLTRQPPQNIRTHNRDSITVDHLKRR